MLSKRPKIFCAPIVVEKLGRKRLSAQSMHWGAGLSQQQKQTTFHAQDRMNCAYNGGEKIKIELKIQIRSRPFAFYPQLF